MSATTRVLIMPGLGNSGPQHWQSLWEASLVVASSNDPYLSPERAREFAGAWGSRLVEVGEAGHLNTASGYGPWPEGRRLLEQWLREL